MERAQGLFEQYEEESEDDGEPFQTENDIHSTLTQEVLEFEKECLDDY